MNIVLFEQTEIDRPLPLKDSRAEHILKILHKQPGSSFTAGIINGSSGSALITDIVTAADGAKMPGIYFTFTPDGTGMPLYPLSMIIGFPRPIQLKRLFRDMAGLGVSSIHLTGTELGEKSYRQSNIVERGAAYAALLDGTAQAKSTHVPELILHENVRSCLAYIAAHPAGSGREPAHTNLVPAQSETAAKRAVKILLDNIAPQCRLSDCLQNAGIASGYSGHLFAAVGSERGWTDSERRQFSDAGFTLCSMGSRVLRTETAATAAASIILSHLEVI